MKSRLLYSLKILETILILLLSFFLLAQLIPLPETYFKDFGQKTADREGRYFPASDPSYRPYYGSRLRVEGASVNGSDIRIYLTSWKFFYGSGLPRDVLVKADDGTVLTRSSGAATSSFWLERGGLVFRGLPESAQSVDVIAESYGQSAAFHIPLAKEDSP